MIEQPSHSLCEDQSIVEIDGCYQVEAIVNKKVIKKNGRYKDYYLIRWKGYPKQDDHTWEPLQNLMAVHEMVEEFDKSRKALKTREGDTEEKKQSNKNQVKQSGRQHEKHNEGLKRVNNNDTTTEASLHKLKKLNKTHSQSNSNRCEQNKSNHYLIQSQRKDQVKKKFEQKRRDYPKQTTKSNTTQNPPKRQNNFLAIETPQTSEAQKDFGHKSTPLSQYGKILNHLYKNGQIYYQVQALNQEGKPIRTVLQNASKIKQEYSIRLYEYLQKYLIQLEQMNLPKMQ